MWNKCLIDILISFGSKGCKTDSSLFYLHSSGVKIFCLIYVDDIWVMRNSCACISSLVAKLESRFAVKDLGKLSYFFGIEATWTPSLTYLKAHKCNTATLWLLLPHLQADCPPMMVNPFIIRPCS